MSLKERDKVIKCPIVKNNIKYLDRLTDKES